MTVQNPLKRLPLFWRTTFAKWFPIVLVVLAVVYGVTGFFIIPGIIETRAQEFVSEKFQRKLGFT